MLVIVLPEEGDGLVSRVACRQAGRSENRAVVLSLFFVLFSWLLVLDSTLPQWI